MVQPLTVESADAVDAPTVASATNTTTTTAQTAENRSRRTEPLMVEPPIHGHCGPTAPEPSNRRRFQQGCSFRATSWQRRRAGLRPERASGSERREDVAQVVHEEQVTFAGDER